MPETELQSSILEISEKLKKRTVSPLELTRDCLERIEKLNSGLNAFITITGESAMSQARQRARRNCLEHDRCDTVPQPRPRALGRVVKHRGGEQVWIVVSSRDQSPGDVERMSTIGGRHS